MVIFSCFRSLPALACFQSQLYLGTSPSASRRRFKDAWWERLLGGSQGQWALPGVQRIPGHEQFSTPFNSTVRNTWSSFHMEEIISGVVRTEASERERLKSVSLTEIFVTNDLRLADFQISLHLLVVEIVPSELQILETIFEADSFNRRDSQGWFLRLFVLQSERGFSNKDLTHFKRENLSLSIPQTIPVSYLFLPNIPTNSALFSFLISTAPLLGRFLGFSNLIFFHLHTGTNFMEGTSPHVICNTVILDFYSHQSLDMIGHDCESRGLRSGCTF